MTRPDPAVTAAAVLPPGVRVVWVAAMVGLVVLFAWRAARSSGDRRLWLGVYAFAAACMGVMFGLNPMTGPGLSSPSLGVLAVAGLGAIGLAWWMFANRYVGGFDLPWVLALADVVILAYIQVPSPSRPVIVCSAMAAYLAVQVFARAIGAFRARRASTSGGGGNRLVGAVAGPAPELVAAGAGRSRPVRSSAPQGRDTSTSRGSMGIPAGLSLLTLGMFYMISI